jgi:hypothetical protein
MPPMRINTASEKVVAILLSAWLAACSATTRSVAPVGADELAHSVLFLREMPDGSVALTWRRVEDVDLSQYQYSGVSTHDALCKRDCDEELIECVRECMSRPLPRGYGHMTYGGAQGAKEKYCNDRCRQPYLDCRKLQELQPQEFSALDSAADWSKRHHKLLLAGSVVIIAGVIFVVASGGTGLIVLVPAVLLASSEIGTTAGQCLGVVSP